MLGPRHPTAPALTVTRPANAVTRINAFVTSGKMRPG